MPPDMEEINRRPKPFDVYTAKDLWTDEHTSQQMLSFHLNGDVDISSRNAKFIQDSVAWISAHFKVGKGTKIADFGCGPGLYANGLARVGAEVVGIDFSKRSIEYAEKTATEDGLTIRYVNQDYTEFNTAERFHLICMIMCDFCALSPLQRRHLLKKFHSIIKPGGAILLDVYSLRAFEQKAEATAHEKNLLNGFWSSEEYDGYLNTFKYDTEKVVLDKYTIIQPGRTRVVYNWLQHFSPEMLERELADCGFRVDALLGDVKGSPFDESNDEFAVIAKPEP